MIFMTFCLPKATSISLINQECIIVQDISAGAITYESYVQEYALFLGENLLTLMLLYFIELAGLIPDCARLIGDTLCMA